MISVILWVIAFILAAVPSMPLWSRIGPRVYALSRSHAVQIAGMAATFIITFIAARAVLQFLTALFTK